MGKRAMRGVASFAVACLLASVARTESHGILESIQDIVGVDLGEAYTGPFSDNHPLMDVMRGQTAKPKAKLPTLAEALEEGTSSPRDVPSPFEEIRQVPIRTLVRRVSKAQRLSIPKLLAAKHGRETSPFHIALKAATRRVKHARKLRGKKQMKTNIRALSHVTKVLASPMSITVPQRHTPKRKARARKVNKAHTIPKHPSTKQLLKALQNGISGVDEAERSVVKTASADAKIVAVSSLKKGSSDAYKKLLDRVKKP